MHPAIAESCASAIDGVVSDPVSGGCLALAAVAGPDLLRRFARVSDGRSDQGRDHPVAVVLTLCAAAVLAGMRSEGNSRARTGSGPRAMAALRCLAIGALHLAGRRDITEATRWAARVMHRPFQLLGLTP